jgi:hypothetical protein
MEWPEGLMLWRRGKAYSQDLRMRVLAEADDGARVGEIATALRVSVSDVSKVLSRRNTTGETAARPQRCQLTPKLADLHDIRSGPRSPRDRTRPVPTCAGGCWKRTGSPRAKA